MTRKTPEARRTRATKPAGAVDRSNCPPLYDDRNDADEAANAWLAHVQAGRIPVR